MYRYGYSLYTLERFAESTLQVKLLGQTTPITIPTRFLESSSVLNEILTNSDADSTFFSKIN